MASTKEKLFGVVEGFYGKPWTIIQRKELFRRMKQFNLNVYMYAPKDDFKHRAYWRELYSVEEGEQLGNLIRAAKENDVKFYYAISPGLDMVYSSSKEVNFLKRKLEQVAQFGCDAFAILFDDIEPELSETDKEIFQSYAQAQVSVTNSVYEALGKPRFLFCPTEYCASRASPNVRNSEYLNTIGNKLINDIDIMWTGPKVISKVLTVQQMQELTDVLKRKPVIWDNLTANDFDQRRVFLGPYDGRSTDIKEYIAGVLTNPNCEYEANFITLHTISYWSKCVDEIKSKDLIEDSEFNSENFDNLSSTIYHPKRALKLAIESWLPEFNKCKNVFPKPSDIIATPLAAAVNNLENNPLQVSTAVSSDDLTKDRNDQMIDDLENTIKDGAPISEINSDSAFQPITKELTNSLLDPPVILNPLEPMDTDPTNNGANKLNEPNVQLTDETMEEPVSRSTSEVDLIKEIEIKEDENIGSQEEMQTEQPANENEMNYEDINFLVDLFYLPFEHGSNAIELLNEFNWLINNSYVIGNYRAKKAINPDKSTEVIEWYDRASKFEKTSEYVARLLNKLIQCKNRCLIYELYPYCWDIYSVVSLLNSYIKWLSLGHVPAEPSNTFLQSSFNWFSKGYRYSFESGDQEPWIFRNGLSGDLQRLLPIEGVNDLFVYKPPDSPSSHIFNIRPYLSSDEQFVYDVCRKTSQYLTNDDFLFNDVPDLIGDKCVGSFLTLSSDFCFVVEDTFENKICGYILAAPDSQQFQKKLEMAWLPDLCLKYSAPVEKLSKGEKLTSVEEMINDLHEEHKRKFIIPDPVYNNYPSICRIDLMDYVLENDASVPKRLLTCLLAALKANGSKGLFSIANNSHDKKAIEFYSKLGFQEIYCPNELKANEQDIFLGRNI